jgi:KaiC/GvpD/RAD55 family RecA-like ATPase
MVNKKHMLVIDERNITKLLQDKYAKLKKTGWITLLNAPIENYADINREAIRVLIEDMDFEGIYITVNRPANQIISEFSKEGIDISKLKFVDAISQTYGKTPEKNSKIRYVFGPLNIEGIVSAVKEFLSEIKMTKRRTFVFIDSITTVLLYNHLPRTIRFSKFLTDDLRKLKVNGIMVSVATGLTSDRLIKEVKQLCDEVIDIGKV